MRERAAAILLGAALLVAGCSPNPIVNQARAATIAAGVLSAGGEVVKSARNAAFDRVEAAYPNDPEHDHHLDQEDARWRPVFAALDEARSSLQTWIDALVVAHLAGAGSDGLELLRPIVAIAARAVQAVAHALELARALGADVPNVPSGVLTLANVAGGP